MAMTEVTAKTGNKPAVTVKYDFGSDLKASVEKFGEETSHSHLVASVRLAVQDLIRAGIDAGKSPAEIQKIVDAYRPGVKKRGKSKTEKILAEYEAMDPAARKELLAKLSK